MILAVLLALLAAAITAALLARARHAYCPVAACLAIGLACDAVGELLRPSPVWQLSGRSGWFLALAPRPYTSLARAAFHLEQALLLAWPAAIVALALVVFARVRPWPAWATWLIAIGLHVLGYPTLRGEPLGMALRVEQALAVAVLVWCVVRWRREDRQPEHAAAMVLVVAEIHVLLFSFTGSPFELWPVAQIVYTLVFSVLTVMQWRLWRWLARINAER